MGNQPKARDIRKDTARSTPSRASATNVRYGELTSFPQRRDDGGDEVAIFVRIVYRSREHRDAINKKCMTDPRLQGEGPFDPTRMIFGGFDMWLQMKPTW